MKRLLFPLVVLLLGNALAQDTVTYEPSRLAASFAALAALVVVATQFAKQHLVDALLAGLKDKNPNAAKWVVIGLAFVIAQVGAFALQFVFGGITDPLFAAIVLPGLKALAFGFAAGLSAAGFHGFASGFAQNIGKAVAIALALAQGRKGDAVAELLKVLMSGALWGVAQDAAKANAELSTRSGSVSPEEQIANQRNMNRVVDELEIKALEAARAASLSKEDTARLVESLRKETVNLGLKSTWKRAAE